MNRSRIYMDYGASTPVREEVLEAMQPYWSEEFGNASSKHTFGRRARQGIELARGTVANILQCDSREIVFTSCGSESDNLALRGVMWAARKDGRGNHMITSAIEHKAVLDTAIQLRDLFGFELTILPVDSTGLINTSELKDSIRESTVLISIMAANNEIGTLQPIEEIGEVARQHGVLFHTDAIQVASSAQWNLRLAPIDLFSLSAHKFYGPKGVGILFVRDGTKLISNITGGGQEDGRRAGTSNVPLAVGAAKALLLASSERVSSITHYQKLRDAMIEGVLAAMPDNCILTGHPTLRLSNHASFALRNTDGNDLLMHMDVEGISASSGSACLTGNPEPSPILEALGLGEEWTRGGLRLTVGRFNNLDEVSYVVDKLHTIMKRLRQLHGQFA